MHTRKRLTILAVSIAFALFIAGSVADLITLTKNTSINSGLSDFGILKPESKLERSVTVPNSPAMLKVMLNSTDKLIMRVELNNMTEYAKNESQLQTNFVLNDPGEHKVIFQNNNSKNVTFDYTLTLTTYSKSTYHPYVGFVLPTIVAGEITLCLILPINLYENKKGKRNSKLRDPIIFLIIVGLALGFMPMLSFVSGAKTPLVSPMSSSMRPTIKPGDLAIVTGINPRALEVGDIIVYDEIVKNLQIPNPSSLDQPIIHRIAEIKIQNNKQYFITKGDNNPTLDDWFVPEEGVTGKVVLVIPFLGNVINFLSRTDVKILIIAVTVVTLILWPNKKPKRAEKP